MRLVAIVCLLGCGGKEDATSTGGSATAAAKPAGSATAGSAKPPPSEKVADVVVKDALGYDSQDRPDLRYGFDKRAPLLPALSGDGTSIADWDSEGAMMVPVPYVLAITPLDGKGKTERLELVSTKLAMAEAEAGHDWQSDAPSPKAVATLKKNAEAISKRLQGFGSLVEIPSPTDHPMVTTVKVGRFVLTSKQVEDDDILDLTLSRDGKVVKKEHLKDYETKESPESFGGEAHCTYSPRFRGVYTDQSNQQLYVFVYWRHHDDCSEQNDKVVIWPLGDDDDAAIAKVMRGQLEVPAQPAAAVFAADAQLVRGTELAKRDAPPPTKLDSHYDRDVTVTRSRDGKSAWASMTTKLAIDKRDDPWRISSLLVKTDAGWRIVATTWTKPVPDDVAAKDAKAGKLKAGTFTADPGDAPLRETFAKLATDGLDADATARTDLIVIGTAQGERLVGGKSFANLWNGSFKGKTTVVSSIARVAPSGTTGWVAATLELAKGSYKLPFHAFAVYDKTDKGWTLVHVQFSI